MTMDKYMKNKVNYAAYWRKKGIDINEEILIYKYLCNALGRREVKKYQNIRKFYTYTDWKNYVLCKLLVLKENDEIDEFEHYLILRQRKCEIAFHGMSEQQVALSAGIIVLFLTNVMSNAASMKMNINGIMWIMVEMFAFLMIMLGSTCGMIRAMNKFELNRNFYNDYLEIINTLKP